MRSDPVTGFVDDAGHFAFDEGQRETFTARLSAFAGKEVVIEVAERASYRSKAANRYYWSVIVAAAVEATGQDADSVHEVWKDQFLPSETKQVEFFHQVYAGYGCGTWCVRAAVKSKAARSSFDYVEECRQWLLEWYNVATPDPDKEYWKKR
jgi:hypothetical protein